MAERVRLKGKSGWWYAVVCDRCSKLFHCKKSHAQFCSAACRKYASRARSRLAALECQVEALKTEVARFGR